MKIYFSHGKKYGPTDPKIIQLAEIAKKYNFETKIIDSTSTIDPDERVQFLLKEVKDEKEDDFILVGASMGGYVSLVVSEKIKPKGLFLIAPAIYIKRYKQQTFQPLAIKEVEIIHGWNDQVVPVENSIKFSKEKKCNLHLISANHKFEESLDTLALFFEQYLKRIIR